MARLVLHIGTKKTGSTLIQALLAQNRDRLSSTGWSYPDFLQKRNHAEFALIFQPRITETHRHYGLTSAAKITARRRELDGQLSKLVTSRSKWIITSEYFSSRLITDVQVAEAVGFLRNHFDEIEVVVALRRQEFVLPSVFSQKVKTGFPSVWSKEFCEKQRSAIDCERLVDRWARVVGRDSISAIPYLEAKKADPGWLIGMFAEASGIPIDESWTTPPRSDANRSLSAEEKTPVAVPEIDASRAVALMVAMSEPAGPIAWGQPGGRPLAEMRTGLRSRIRARRKSAVAG